MPSTMWLVEFHDKQKYAPYKKFDNNTFIYKKPWQKSCNEEQVGRFLFPTI